jgi:hypothetical protein
VRGWAALALLTLISAAPSAAMAQSVGATTAPARGTAQRNAILNTIRPAVEADLRGRVEFTVTCLQVENGWALANLEPQRPGGRPIEEGTLPDSDFRDGLTVTAILRFQNRRWRLVDHAIGATDVWYEGQVPRSLTRARCY